MEPKLIVLAVDDDDTQIEKLRVFAETVEYPKIEYLSAASAREAFDILEKRNIDLVLTDYRLPDHNGMEVLQKIKEMNPLIRVVLMTAFDSAEDAVEILHSGGDDYLVKPTDFKEIEHLFVMIYEKLEIKKENSQIEKKIEEQFETLPLVYGSKKTAEMLNLAARSAVSNTTVLITGESGTGKELVARLIHQSSERKDKPFVTVNISALPETLVESELFGHTKGAFTGAEKERMGRFEEADGGTLFIDEVGDISPAIQVKLLRVLQSGEVQRIGENSTRTLDVRIIAATNRSLETMVEEGTFRSDLYWRLNVIPVSIPPLRERKEDIPPLVQHFIEKFNRKNERSLEGISREALYSLMSRPFPGNTRELENIIERATVLARGKQITLSDLPPKSPAEQKDETCEPKEDLDYEENMKDFEVKLLTRALEEAEWNQSRAARILEIGERKLRSRMERLGLRKNS
ncbi:MAG: sigma-54 dependent transcriptional regulator [Spirochaetia bacterium]